jgi:pteridine reductase
MDTLGSCALVTGASKRVGKAIALALTDAGCDIVIHFNTSLEEAESAAAEIRSRGRKAWLVQADLERGTDITAMIAELALKAPPIDILVNSASVYYKTPFAEIAEQQWDNNLQVNLKAPFLLSQALGLKMAERGQGKIINIADCSVRRLYKDHLPYLLSKAALVALTELLALELAPAVQVNTVAPGTVLLPSDSTESMRDQSVRRSLLKKIGTAEDVAALVLYLVQQGDFMTGGYYPVDGGAGIR